MPRTFIVVDDCEADRYLACRTIRDCGYDGEIVEFSDGRAMLELLDDKVKFAEFRESAPEPYLVVLDINMPLVNGFDVASALDEWEKKSDERCWFVVMMLTSSAHEGDRDRAGQYEVIHDFATKPLTPEALTAMLGELPAEIARPDPFAQS